MPYYNGDPKRDHNFDNHPYELESTFPVDLIHVGPSLALYKGRYEITKGTPMSSHDGLLVSLLLTVAQI